VGGSRPGSTRQFPLAIISDVLRNGGCMPIRQNLPYLTHASRHPVNRKLEMQALLNHTGI